MDMFISKHYIRFVFLIKLNYPCCDEMFLSDKSRMSKVQTLTGLTLDKQTFIALRTESLYRIVHHMPSSLNVSTSYY